ncbi:Gag-Pol poly, partial [Paramuricea clavata]
DTNYLLDKKEDIRKYFKKIEALTIAIQELDAPNIPKYDNELIKDEERTDEIMLAFSKAAKSVSIPTAEQRRYPGPASRRINDALKPSVLSKDASPIEMRYWVDSFKSYYTSNDMDSFTILEKQSYFKTLLDTDLKTRIVSKMAEDTDVFGKDGCIDILENDFLARYPLFSRRLDFFQSQQRNGQTFTDFLANLKELSKLADLDKLSVEEMFVFCALRGTTDTALLDDFLELQNKSLKDIENAANIYESKLVSRSKLNRTPKESNIMKVSTPNQRRNVRQRPKQDFKPEPAQAKPQLKRPTTVREMKERGLCTRCGKSGHLPNECSYERSVVCNHCGITGHIAPACMGRGRINAIQSNERDASPSASSSFSD